ncbi:MAG TPA: helix-hairpin-helix domain-containing protein [Gaiellaceae bacterium]|nr:helix-hairpin-helix domain-containing protein [Gaiellaceae bacterium]
MSSFSFGVERRRLLAVALLALVVLVAAWRHSSRGRPAAAPALRVQPVAGASRAAPPARAPSVVVDVAGAVRRPGLVRLPPGSRVAAAVARAGGLARDADRDGVNLAAPVSDGQQVLVPARGAAGAGAAGGASGSAPAGPISLSAATAEQLDALPGIGPVTAQKIVDYRTQHGAFRSVDDLDAIAGIGPARIAQLQGLVVP